SFTPAPSTAGFDWTMRLTGRMDMTRLPSVARLFRVPCAVLPCAGGEGAARARAVAHLASSFRGPSEASEPESITRQPTNSVIPEASTRIGVSHRPSVGSASYPGPIYPCLTAGIHG